MSDLYQRVSAALNEGWQRHINDQTVAADTMAEAAVEVFAAWLRERAAECREAWVATLPPKGCEGQRERGAELALLDLAEALADVTTRSEGDRR